jgi:hypothetical protein
MSESIFEKGLKLDVTKHIEKKGRFNYLSWAWAVQELRKLDPKAEWEVREFTSGVLVDGKQYDTDTAPYMKTEAGCFVEVLVVLSDGTKSQQIHPVLDNNNKTLADPNAFQINTSIQRCLVKAIALASGIGLHIYAGEDLPPGDEKEEKKVEEMTVELLLSHLPACKTLESLDKYMKDNSKFVKSLFDKEKEEVIAEFSKRKVEINELGGNSQAQRGE